MAEEQEAPREEYVLLATGMRHVREKFEGGQIRLYPKRYVRGDIIELTEEEATRYLRSGAVVSKDDYDAKAQAREDAERRARADVALTTLAVDPNASGQVDAAVVETVPRPTPAVDLVTTTVDGIAVEDVADMDELEDDEEGLNPEDDRDEPVDSQDTTDARSEPAESQNYEEMTFADLQALAKRKTGNGGGSTSDLIARLKSHDATQ